MTIKTTQATLLLLVITSFLSTSLAQPSVYMPILSVVERAELENGGTILRELKPSSPQGQTVEVIGLIKAPGENLVQLLTDYEAYPEFMSAVNLIGVVDQTGETTTLNYILNPILGYTKKYRIKIAPVKLDQGVWKIEWQMIPWPGLSPQETIGDTRGYWLILEETARQSLVQYHVYSDPGPVPFGLGGMVDVLSKRSIKAVFLETRSQAETLPDP